MLKFFGAVASTGENPEIPVVELKDSTVAAREVGKLYEGVKGKEPSEEGWRARALLHPKFTTRERESSRPRLSRPQEVKLLPTKAKTAT